MNQNYVSQWMGTLLAFIDKDVNAERCITTMLTSNRSLLEGMIGRKTLQRFLNLLSLNGVKESALRFLAEVSAADGEAVEGNQTEISKRLLINEPKLLLKTTQVSNNDESKTTIKKWISTVDTKDFYHAFLRTKVTLNTIQKLKQKIEKEQHNASLHHIHMCNQNTKVQKMSNCAP